MTGNLESLNVAGSPVGAEVDQSKQGPHISSQGTCRKDVVDFALSTDELHTAGQNQINVGWSLVILEQNGPCTKRHSWAVQQHVDLALRNRRVVGVEILCCVLQVVVNLAWNQYVCHPKGQTGTDLFFLIRQRTSFV